MTRQTKTVTLPQFLTKDQISQAAALYEAQIQSHVIEPNLTAINAKLGQENDARYLAHAVAYVLSQATRSPS